MKEDFSRERVLIDSLEARYKELVAEGDALIMDAKENSYYDTDSSKYLRLQWKSCGHALERCQWCPDGHGPIWRYSYWSAKYTCARSTDLKSITRKEMMRVLRHTKGYSVLKPLDDRRKKIVKELKDVKDAVTVIRRAVRKCGVDVK